MQRTYLYSTVNQLYAAELETKIMRKFPNIQFEIKEEVGYTRYVIEIECNEADLENITEIVENYEDEWTQLEVELWLEGEKTQERRMDLINLKESKMYYELDYCRGLLLDAGIPSTILEQRNFIIPNANVFILQLDRQYVGDALAVLRGEEEENAKVANQTLSAEADAELSDKEKTEAGNLAGNQGNHALVNAGDNFSVQHKRHNASEESAFEPLLEEVLALDKREKNWQLTKRIAVIIFTILFLISAFLGLKF